MAQKEAIMRALMEAMGSSPSAPMTSPRPPRRPRGLGEAGRTMSDSDKLKMLMMKMGESGRTMSDADRKTMRKPMADPMELSPAQIKMLEQMMKQQQGVRDAEERKAFPPASMMKNGGAVRKRKPKKGCVMKGRGGKYKGIK